MQLQFVPVEEFYFALTLDTRVLHTLSDPGLVARLRRCLGERFGQASTVAAAEQNTFNYVFQVAEGAPPGTVVEVFDWGDQVRLSSNYGLERTPSGKVERLASFEERPEFARLLLAHLARELAIPLVG
jgi:hypothetical protein